MSVFDADTPDAWLSAAALHHEAHGIREPFQDCRQQTCTDLKDALYPGWWCYRPPVETGTYGANPYWVTD